MEQGRRVTFAPFFWGISMYGARGCTEAKPVKGCGPLSE